jgi:Flp pilus assembly protein TadG
MTKNLRNESGQAVLMTVLFLTVLIGAAALTTDVGGWYRQQRQAQATADAAALAGAQVLPGDPTQAQVLAATYATDNGGGVPAGGITLRSDFEPNDTVVVKVQKDAPSFFANIFSIDHATVTATAAARAGVPNQVEGVAPIVVNQQQCDLEGCAGCPCFDSETTLPLGKDGAPGAFGFVNLDGGNNGIGNLASWIQNGYAGYLGLGDYASDPGAKFNSNGVLSALDARVGTELLFPVYDTLNGPGANAQYDVIGWVGFHLDCVGTVVNGSCDNTHGNSDALTGYFTKVIWQGIQGTTDQNLPDFGVYSVELVN